MIKTITSIEFVQFILRQPCNKRYDMRDELKNQHDGTPLQHFCKAKQIWFQATGSMDVYDAKGAVVAALERPTQAHFDFLNMEGGGTYGDLKMVIRAFWMDKVLEVSPASEVTRWKFKSEGEKQMMVSNESLALA